MTPATFATRPANEQIDVSDQDQRRSKNKFQLKFFNQMIALHLPQQTRILLNYAKRVTT